MNDYETMIINGRSCVKPICEVCNKEYTQQLRIFKKAIWKNRCKSHRSKERSDINYVKKEKTSSCIDCGIDVHRVSIRCKPCSGKHRSKDRISCVDCGLKLSIQSVSRCLPCHNLNQKKRSFIYEYNIFLRSKEWKSKRLEIIDRDNSSCRMCKKQTDRIFVHHIFKWEDYEYLRYDDENLVCLCLKCHLRIHNNKGENYYDEIENQIHNLSL